MVIITYSFFFFFNDTATTEIYTLSLHDALPISHRLRREGRRQGALRPRHEDERPAHRGEQAFHLQDRKSTRLNSSHANISYAVFCLKKKKGYKKQKTGLE